MPPPKGWKAPERSRGRISGRLVLLIVAALLTSPIWLPAVALAVTDQLDRFDYYVKALEYGLKGLIEYLKFVIELFKTAVSL